MTAGAFLRAAVRLAARLRVLALLACVSPLAAPSTVAAQALDSLEVRKLDFTGADSFDGAILASSLVTAQTRCLALPPLCWIGIGVDHQYLDMRAVEADVLRLRVFYYQQGYRETQVSYDTTRAGDGMKVTFHVNEGEPIRVASLSVDTTAGAPADLLRTLPLHVGDAFSQIGLEASRDSIRTRMYNRGFATAEVLANYTIPQDTPHIAHVGYELIPGGLARFGDIRVTGAEKVAPAVVHRMLTFREGDRYSREAVLRSQRNLFSQELFSHAEIREELDPATDTLMNVVVQVNEGDLHRVRGGVGLSTAEYLEAEGRWASRSFYGGARRLEARGRISNLFANALAETPLFENSDAFYRKLSGSLSLDFTQPWFFGPLNTFGAGIFIERRSLPDVFVRTAAGGYLSFSRTIGSSANLSISYRPELTKLETADGDFIFCARFTVCGAEEIEELKRARWLAPLAATFVRDRSNSLFAPTRGYVLRLDAEFASRATGSGFEYTRLSGDASTYRGIGNGLVLATRLRPGWAHAIGADSTLGVHPQKRFFSGGPNSVRGYAQYRLGPKVLLIDARRFLATPVDSGGAGCSSDEINGGECDVAALASSAPGIFSVQPVGGAITLEGNFEVRFPVYRDKLRGAAFIDFGQVWESDRAVRFGDLAWTPGVGIRYFSAVGPIRIDIGYNGAGAELVNVVTTEVGAIGEGGSCAALPEEPVDDPRLCNLRVLRPLADPVLWNPRVSFFDKLQFHFSIGQAF